MEFFRSLKRLMQHSLFRKLVAVRIATQASDGILQVGMAAYVLFSPQEQPDARSIALVLAITLLPFSVIGPFVSLTLDRWNRRQVAVITDVIRMGIALGLGALVLNPGLREHWTMWLFYAGVLIAMSLNRYLMAGLSAALPHTVDEDEYLMASSIMPTIGPAGVMIGAAVAAIIRLTMSNFLTTYQADALIFCASAAGFGLTVMLSLRIPRTALGPMYVTDESRNTSTREVLRGLINAGRHLGERPPAAIGLATIGFQRIVFGMMQVSVILLFRNYFHEVTDVDAAMADIVVWAGAMGAGFVLSGAFTPPMVRLLGVRRFMVVLLLGSAVLQIVPGAIFSMWPLVVSGFLLGMGSQSLKICVDTLVQAHVDGDFKGRVFTIYDMIFNAMFVLAAVLTAVLMPADGHSLVGFIGFAIAFAAIGIVFAIVSGRLGSTVFNRGTQHALDVAAEPEPAR